MKKYTSEELKEILELHNKWLNDKEGGVRADLSYADLSYADLSSADLRYADLSSADLRYADLRYADLSYAIGEMRSLQSFQIEKYMVSYTDSILNIGCQSHTIEEWDNFDDEQISNMDGYALEWWNKWKPIIMQIIEMSPAEHTRYVEKEENEKN